MLGGFFSNISTIKDSSNKESKQKPKQEVPKKKQDKSIQKKVETVAEKKTIKQNDDSGWKSFDLTRPDMLVPCEFYVDTGDSKKDIFYGYVAEMGMTCTNEPYKLVVLRKKYNNLYYREVKDCENVFDCPNGFPDCKNCKRGK